MTNLTPKRERFVEEYLVDLNATQAATRAGYSPKTAQQQGSRLLNRPEVRAAIDAAIERRTERVEINQDYVLRGLVENFERSMQHRKVRATASSAGDSEGAVVGDYRYDGSVANKALELLGRHLGMFKDNVNLNVNEDLVQAIRDGRNRARDR